MTKSQVPSTKFQINPKHQAPTKLLLVILLFAIILMPEAALAGGLLPECALRQGTCGLNDLVQTFVNFMRLLLGIVGSAALLFLVYGGFTWLTSGGETKRIEKGREIVKNAVIGLVIVFAAVTIVQFVGQALQVRPQFRIGQPCEGGGILVPNPEDPRRGEPECVNSCSDPLLSTAGYSNCKDPEPGESCIFGLCGIPEQGCCLSTELPSR